MKSLIKKISLICLSMIFIMNVNAQEALSIGTRFGANLDSSDEAILAGNALYDMGYHSYVDIVPTISSLASEIKQYNVSTNTAGVFFLAGHGAPETIEWNYEANGGEYSVGFYKDDTKQPFMFSKITSLNLKKTKMGIFYGCNTAKNPETGYNIAKYAQTKGVKVTTGWVYTLYDVDTNKWATAFFTKLKEGKTFREAYKYANTLSYTHNENMKTHRVYGDATVKIKISSAKAVGASYMLETLDTDSRKRVTIDVNNDSDILKLIIKTIRTEFDDNFNLSDYELETAESPDGIIYDLNYMIDDAKTSHGYTVLVEQGKITVYDNMDDFKKQNKINKKSQLYSTYASSEIDQKELKLKEKELIEKYTEKYDGYTVSLDSIKKIYDDELNKIVLNIYIKIENKVTGGTSIITEVL